MPRESMVQTRTDDDSSVTGFEERFAVIERRIQALLDRNKTLEARIVELEQELARKGDASGELEQLQAVKLRLREKIGGILKSLESLTEKKRLDAPE